MRVVTLVFLFFLLSFPIMFSFSSVTVKAIQDVNVLSNSHYLDSIGNYWIVGEVQNTGSQAYRFVEVTASFYSANGSFVDSSYGFTELSILSAGVKSPFDILYLKNQLVSQIDHYTLYVSFSSASPLPAGLNILSNSSHVDNINYLHVVGQVQNNAVGNASYVEVIATFYDQAGTVVAESFTFTSPTTLQPNQIAPYDLDTSRTAFIASYSLTVESLEYSIQSDTSTPTPIPSPSPTPTPTPTPTPSPTPTTAPTSPPTNPPTQTAATATPTPTNRPATATPSPSPKNSPTPTPRIPEYPTTLIIAALFATATISMIAIKIKTQKNNS